MGMVVRTNTMSSNAYRQLGMNNTQLSKSLEKLSSGFRINRAGDDSSGLAISEKMKSQIAGLEQASSNSQDGISLVQTAEGALTEVHSMLNRMITLATKSANGTIQNQVDRDAIQSEVDALSEEITRISKSTTFNGIQLLDGSLGSAASVTTTVGKNAVGGAAAIYSYDLTGKDSAALDTKLIDGVAFTWNTDLATTLSDFVGTYNAAGKNYTASTDGTKITLTANAIGTGSAPATDTGVTATTVTAGAAPTTAATGADTVLDYGTKTGKDVLGTTVTVGGKTYEFVDNGAAVKTTGNVAVSLTAGETETSVNIAKALQDAIKTDTTFYDASAAGKYNVVASGSKLTITSNDTGTSSTAAEVKQAGGGLTLQIGTTSDDFNMVAVSVEDLSAKGLGIDNLDVSTADAARKSIQTINDAINKVSTNRGNLGALQNRLEHAISNLDTTAENMDSANSAIRDTDMAKEMMNYTKMNILSQAAQAMLAQANQQPQNILQLLQ